MKILTVIGTRPQFIKAAIVSRSLREKHVEVLIHTGQHYDEQMSEIFFRELDIPVPDYNLEVGSGSHSVQTAEMLIRMEPIFEKEKPDGVLVYGDTNSTLAGALVAAKLSIPVAHVEAGLRSFNRNMPEEINRVLTDHVSRLMFCPTQTAIENLKLEGINPGLHLVGDVMYDAILNYLNIAKEKSSVLSLLNLIPKQYFLLTIHRASNVDSIEKLLDILQTISMLDEIVVFPVHPRTSKAIQGSGFVCGKNIKMVEPLGYLDMLWLEKNARMILTDSGGVQKEAYWLSIPCITLREETEWIETVSTGWNIIVGSERYRILNAVEQFLVPALHPEIFGNGQAGKRIVRILENELR